MITETIIYSGFHSEISLGHIPPEDDQSGLDYITKLYKNVDSTGFSGNEAVNLIASIDRFARIATELGINIPPNLGFAIHHNSHPGQYYISERTEHVGANLTSRIKSGLPKEEILQDLEDTLGLYRQVWEAGFPISLDPPPLNFCRDNSGHLWYVDCMPPRQVQPDGQTLSEIPTPSIDNQNFIEARYFSPLQARVIYAQWLRAVSTRQDITAFEVKQTIGSVLSETAYRLIDIDENSRQMILQEPMPEHADILRIITAEAHLEGLISSKILDELFHLTHIKPGGILPSQRNVNKAASIILDHLYVQSDRNST